jgi:glycosyltransferase involved in cell wall biosynthesis
MDILSLHRPSSRADDLTIIIPAYNEEAGIGQTLQSLKDETRLTGAKVIVISDGSSDRTAEIAAEHGATVIENWSNLGYGASLKRGIQRATTELIAWFDADGQHQPGDLADMVERIHREEAHAVIGARAVGSHVVKKRVLGKRIIKFAAEAAVGRKIPDVNCGLRVFRRVLLLRYLDLLPDGFSASTTSTLLFMKRNHHLVFHPIQTVERIGTSTVRQVRDGLRALHTILRITIMFNALRTFNWCSGMLIAAGLLYGVTVGLIKGGGFPVFAAMTTILGVQVFCLGLVCDQITAMRLAYLGSTSRDVDLVEQQAAAGKAA